MEGKGDAGILAADMLLYIYLAAGGPVHVVAHHPPCGPCAFAARELDTGFELAI